MPQTLLFLHDLRARSDFHCLLQLHQLQVEIVAARVATRRPGSRNVVALIVQARRTPSQRGARRRGRGPGGVDGVRAGQLALAGKNAMNSLSGAKTNTLSADQVSLRRDKGFANLELGTRPDRVCVSAGQHAAQPIAEARDLGPHRPTLRANCRQIVDRRGRCLVLAPSGKAAGRRCRAVEPVEHRVEAIQLDRIESVAEHRFDASSQPASMSNPASLRASAFLLQPLAVVLADQSSPAVPPTPARVLQVGKLRPVCSEAACASLPLLQGAGRCRATR